MVSKATGTLGTVHYSKFEQCFQQKKIELDQLEKNEESDIYIRKSRIDCNASANDAAICCEKSANDLDDPLLLACDLKAQDKKSYEYDDENKSCTS